MILVIDDDPEPYEGFARALGTGIEWCNNRVDAIRTIHFGEGRYSRIYLDHDGVDGDLIATYAEVVG